MAKKNEKFWLINPRSEKPPSLVTVSEGISWLLEYAEANLYAELRERENGRLLASSIAQPPNLH